MRTALLYISMLAFLSLSVGQPFQEIQNETHPNFLWIGVIGPDIDTQRLTGTEDAEKETTGKAATGKEVTGRETGKKITGKNKTALTAMEGLDIIQKNYAANFVKEAGEGEDYYYKLPIAEYYLYYEGQGESESEYLYHLYEFVVDDEILNIGHTVTYGWYTVDKYTGKITDYSP